MGRNGSTRQIKDGASRTNWVAPATQDGSIARMQVSVGFQDEQFAFDVPDDRLIAAWRGPDGVATADVAPLIAHALEEPIDFPPLRKAVVPGDRVVIALGADCPEPGAVLEVIAKVMESAGVTPDLMTVLTEPEAPATLAGAIPKGVAYVVHDPDDRNQIAYLSATSSGRRVYLNRQITDADFVLPVGRLGFDPVLGYRGPWSVLYANLSDAETRKSFRSHAADADDSSALLKQSTEVSWLLGCQFQLGLVPGVTGLREVVAGLGAAVYEQGRRRVDDDWTVRPESRAELVIVGIGRAGETTGIDSIAQGIATATRLVQRGGKIVVLSRASGAPGPAMRRLIEADDPRAGPFALRGRESAPDFLAARQLARGLAWADIYLLSALDPDDVEGLSMVGLDRPEDMRRLATTSGSCLVVSHADHARGRVAEESD